MKKTRILVSALLLCVIFAGTFNFVTSVDAQPTLESVKLPDSMPTAWQMEYNNGIVWYGGYSSNNGYIVKVNTATVLADPVSSSQSWVTAPTYYPFPEEYPGGVPAYSGASAGVAVAEGYVWSGGQYSGGDTSPTEILSRLNPLTGAVTYYKMPVTAKGIRSIRYDGAGSLWIAAKRIHRFFIANSSFQVCSAEIGLQDLMIDGSVLWATSPSQGLIRFDMSPVSAGVYNPHTSYAVSSPANMLAKDGKGNIWYSMNNVQKVAKFNGASTTEYSTPFGSRPTGGLYDAPYGIVFDAEGILWCAGYESQLALRFDPVKEQVLGTQAADNMVYYPVSNGVDKVYAWGQGSVYMNVITLASAVVTTTKTSYKTITIIGDGTTAYVQVPLYATFTQEPLTVYTVTVTSPTTLYQPTTVTQTQTVTTTKTVGSVTTSSSTTSSTTVVTTVSDGRIPTRIVNVGNDRLYMWGRLETLSGQGIANKKLTLSWIKDYPAGSIGTLDVFTDSNGNYRTQDFDSSSYIKGMVSVVFEGDVQYVTSSWP